MELLVMEKWQLYSNHKSKYKIIKSHQSSRFILTGSFYNLELQNPSYHVRELYKIRRGVKIVKRLVGIELPDQTILFPQDPSSMFLADLKFVG